MSTYYYQVSWYPFGNYLKAKNYKDAWRKLTEMYSEYKNIKQCIMVSRCQ